MREQQKGLYSPAFEHDNCGIGAVVNSRGIKSHLTVERALHIVENLEHRAGKDAEGKTGDGVGILLQISHKFFSRVCKQADIQLGEEGEYGIAQLFFPQEELKRNQAKKMFEIIVEKEGMELLGFRKVPVHPEILGHKARECMPDIQQAFIKKPEQVEKGLDFDRKLYIARRVFEQSNDNTYVVSMSSRTIVYKGMFLVGQLRTFFGDLQDPDYESAIATVHSRFSTNTNPSWERAHPNRFIVHNGEINTIRGNADKMQAREETMESPHLKEQLHKVLPVVDRKGSDSAMLDNTLEFLVMRRHGTASGCDDHHSGALVQQPDPVPGDPGFLPVLRHHDGTLGRTGFHRIFRRGAFGSGAGPQRPAPIPVLCDEKRRCDPCFRGGGPSPAGRRDPAERTAPPGENASGGYQKAADPL